MRDLQLRLSQNLGVGLAVVLFLIFWLTYNALHPKGFSTDVLVQNANEAFVLGMVAMAQTVPVLMGGLDLSVGAVMTMVNCVASTVLTGSPLGIVGGILLCLVVGTLAGLVNGLVVVYGRIQPIIATLATGAVYIGIALFLRPTPGGKVDEDLSWAMTNDLKEFAGSFHFADDGAAAWFQPFAWLPVPLVVAVLVVLIVWLPFRASVTGRGVYAIGSSEGAAYMSGVPIERSKLAAFTLAGLFSGIGGLYLAMQTSSGNADVLQAGAYTLNSIAALVIGGTSLMGGSGTVLGGLLGAAVIAILQIGFTILGVSAFNFDLIIGLAILASMVLNVQIQRLKNLGRLQ
jgi:ribose transport system permease protein